LDGVFPITGIPRQGLPALALVTGDPQRIPTIADMLDGPRAVGAAREYVTYTGAWKGTEVAVSSHGVGAPGAVLLFHELAAAGVRTIVRAGTCGALVERISDGDLIVATGAVREDGVTDLMAPPSFPATCTPEVVMALQTAIERLGHPWHSGPVLTSALFFPGPLGSTLKRHAGSGVIGVEMELSALLVFAGLMGLRAGGVFAVDGHPVGRADPMAYEPGRPVVREAVGAAITVALDALADLSAEAA
jgi:uridine phosphorylase